MEKTFANKGERMNQNEVMKTIKKFNAYSCDDDPIVDEEGFAWCSKISFIETGIFGMCGCGDPDGTLEYISRIMKQLKYHKWAEFSHPEMFIIYFLNNKGMAEHGSTAGCSWLTEYGEKILAEIDACIKIIEQQELQSSQNEGPKFKDEGESNA